MFSTEAQTTRMFCSCCDLAYSWGLCSSNLPASSGDCYHGYEDSSLAYEGRCIGPPIRGCSGRRHWPSYECLPPPPGKSPVVMLHGLDPVKMNADRVFNLFCLYGNVERVGSERLWLL